MNIHDDSSTKGMPKMVFTKHLNQHLVEAVLQNIRSTVNIVIEDFRPLCKCLKWKKFNMPKKGGIHKVSDALIKPKAEHSCRLITFSYKIHRIIYENPIFKIIRQLAQETCTFRRMQSQIKNHIPIMVVRILLFMI